MFSAHFQAGMGVIVIIATAIALVYEHAPNLFNMLLGVM